MAYACEIITIQVGSACSISPLYTANNQGFGHCSLVDQGNPFHWNLLTLKTGHKCVAALLFWSCFSDFPETCGKVLALVFGCLVPVRVLHLQCRCLQQLLVG